MSKIFPKGPDGKPLTTDEFGDHPPLASYHYAAYHGLNCPVCMSEDLGFSHARVNDLGTLSQRGSCNGCKAIWSEEYVLTGYKNLQRGPEDV